jgi:uncharacterized protein YhfF
MNPQIKDFWQAWLNSLPPEADQPETMPEVWHFCNDEESANHLAELTLNGTKRATAGAVWSYEAEGEAIPQPGDLSIIINWQEEPVCIIETTQIDIVPYNEVSEAFAHVEGEGDKSLAYWKKVHWEFFSEEMKAIGREAVETMPVACERFRVIYPETAVHSS